MWKLKLLWSLQTVLAEVIISDASLSVGMVTSTVTSLQMASCDVRITRLRGLVSFLLTCSFFSYCLSLLRYCCSCKQFHLWFLNTLKDPWSGMSIEHWLVAQKESSSTVLFSSESFCALLLLVWRLEWHSAFKNSEEVIFSDYLNLD